MAIVSEDYQIQQAEVHSLLGIRAEELKEPKANEKVHKDECVYCFKTPFFSGGIYVCLRAFIGFCENHVGGYSQRTGSTVFLNIVHEKVESEGGEPKDKIPRTNALPENVLKTYFVCLYPYTGVKVPITSDELGDNLTRVVGSVIAHLSADVQTQMDSGACSWEGTALLETPVVNDLVQLDVIKQEPENGWTCEEEGCGFQNNLWLNLSDGSVKCGRGQVALDGNGHALKHAKETGFRLVVRLGTIQNGNGEVYLYDFENDNNEGFVRNPNLKQHLAHFGLDIDKFTKTEQNFLELEKSFQFKHDWNVIQEQGLDLTPKFGPGFTGLVNLGSSCYMNSVLQTLLVIPDFVEFYDKGADRIFQSKSISEFYDDFNCQLAKLLHSMNSTNDFSKVDSKLNGIEPKRFKDVAGKNHQEFSTMKQQDVEHYIRHLCEIIDKEVPSDLNPVNAIRFKSLQRFEDIASGHVRYSSHDDVILSLTIPHENNENTENIGDMETNTLPSTESAFSDAPLTADATADGKVSTNRNKVTLAECIAKTFADDEIEDYMSPVTKEKKGAKQAIRLGTFPDFLFVQLKRFTYDVTGEQKKLSVDVEDVDELNLEAFKSSGIQPGETKLVEADSSQQSSVKTVKNQKEQEIIQQLLAMGFGENAARKAVLSANNQSLEEAANWLIVHHDDAGLNDPDPSITSAELAVAGGDTTVNEEAVQQLVQDFSFSRHQAIYGLKATNGGLNEAVNWLFENIDKVSPEVERMDVGGNGGSGTASGSNVTDTLQVRDGKPVYRLRGFISHIGKNPNCGHYVVHLNKDGVWYIYNDEKVCISQKPPKTCGYVYLYERQK